MPKAAVSKEMLLDGAQMCIAGTVAAIAGFLKERKIPISDFTAYMGDRFEGMQHLLALEVLPMGAEVVLTKSSADRAEVTLTTLPPAKVLEKFGTTPKELLRGFGVTQREFESIYDSFAPAAKAIGMKLAHHIKDGQEVLVIEKKS